MQITICPIEREMDAYVAMGRGHELATHLAFNAIDRTRIEIVILELSRNILAHAGGGELRLELLEQADRRGLVVEARDDGPGITDVDLALRDGYSTTHTLGTGLPGVRRLMDSFEIETAPGKGTCVRAIKWISGGRGVSRVGGAGA